MCIPLDSLDIRMPQDISHLIQAHPVLYQATGAAIPEIVDCHPFDTSSFRRLLNAIGSVVTWATTPVIGKHLLRGCFLRSALHYLIYPLLVI